VDDNRPITALHCDVYKVSVAENAQEAAEQSWPSSVLTYSFFAALAVGAEHRNADIFRSFAVD